MATDQAATKGDVSDMTIKDDLLNGSGIIGAGPKLSDNQIACIDLIKEALAEALEGKVFGVGIALCMDGGWATVMAGSRPGDLNLACDDMKRKILDAVTERKPAAKPSNILRARMS